MAFLSHVEWDKEPAHLDGIVDQINAALLSEKLPLAETVSFREDIARFQSIPTPITNRRLLAATLGQLEDAVQDVLMEPSNGLSERSHCIRVLRRTLAQYGNDPQRVEMDCTSIHGEITRQIIFEELPASEEILALSKALEDSALAIRGTHQQIRRNRNILKSQRLAELTKDDKRTLLEAIPVLHAIADGTMADDFDEDIHNLTGELENEDVERVGRDTRTKSSTFTGVDEFTRTFRRVAKVGIYIRRFPRVVSMIEESTFYRATQIIETLVALVLMGLALF